MSKVCTRCGQGADTTAKFCVSCGHELPASASPAFFLAESETPTCASCRAPLAVGQHFCTECGTAASGQSVAAHEPVGRGQSVATRPAMAIPPLRFGADDLRWIGAFTAAFLVVTIVITLIFGLTLSRAISSDGGSADATSGDSLVRGFAFLATLVWTSHAQLDMGTVGRVMLDAPLLLPAMIGFAALAGIVIGLGRLLPVYSTRQVWLRATVATVVSVATLVFLGMLGRVAETADYVGQLTVSALSFQSVVRFAVLLMLVVVVGSSVTLPAGARLDALLGSRISRQLNRFRPSLAVAGWHLVSWVVVGVLVWPVLWLIKLREHEVPASAMLALWPSAPAALASLGSFSGESFTVSGQGNVPLLGDVNNLLSYIPAQGTYTVFHPNVPLTSWLVIVAGVVLVVLLGGRLAGLRQRANQQAVGFDPLSAAVSAAAIGLVWVPVLLATGSVSASGAAQSVSFNVRVGSPYWTVLLLAVSGLLIEVVALVLGPQLVASLPWLARPLTTGTPAPVMATETVAPHLPSGGAGIGTFLPRESPLGSRPSVPQQARPVSKWWLIGAAGLVALLVLVFAVPSVVGAIYARSHGPQALATQFLTAVVKGDATTATALGHPNLSTAERILLTDEIAKAATRPTSARVKKVTEKSDTAIIETEYVLDGRTVPWELTASKTGTRFGMLPQWELDPVQLPQLSASVATHTITVGDTTIDLAEQADLDGGYVLNAAAYPGVYTLTAGGAGKLFSSEPVRYTASLNNNGVDGTGVDEGAVVGLTPTQAFYNEVDRQLKARVDACVANSSEQTCPFLYLSSSEKVTRVGTYPMIDRSQTEFAPGTETAVQVSAGELATTTKLFDTDYPSTSSVSTYGWKVLPDKDSVTVSYD